MSLDDDLDEEKLIRLLKKSDEQELQIERPKTFAENLLSTFNYIEDEDPNITLYRKKKFLRDKAAEMIGPDPYLLSRRKYKEKVLGITLHSNDVIDMLKEIESYSQIIEQLKTVKERGFEYEEDEDDSIQYQMAVACFTCGKRVGAYEQMFEHLNKTDIRKKYILDYMGMTRMCCREKFEKSMTVPRKLYPEELLNEEGGRGINMKDKDNADSVHIFNVLKSISVGTTSTVTPYINKSYTPVEKGREYLKTTDHASMNRLKEMEKESSKVERPPVKKKQSDEPKIYLTTEQRIANGELGSMIFCGMGPSGPIYTWRITGNKYEAR